MRCIKKVTYQGENQPSSITILILRYDKKETYELLCADLGPRYWLSDGITNDISVQYCLIRENVASCLGFMTRIIPKVLGAIDKINPTVKPKYPRQEHVSNFFI